MKRIGIFSLALTLLASASAENYESMLQDRSERLEVKVAEEVGKQMREMRGKLQYLQNKMERLRTKKASYAAMTEKAVESEDKAPWLFSSFNVWKEYLREQPIIDYLPEKSREEFDISVSYDWGHQSYDTTGTKQDVAHTIFGQATFPLKDAFVASNLLAKSEVDIVVETSSNDAMGQSGGTEESNSPTNHYLSILKDQELAFNSSYSRQELDLHYKRLFFDNKVSLSVSLPLVRETHKIELIKEISAKNREGLQGKNPGFYTTYDHMDDFITKALASHGTSFEKSQESWGVGDVKVAAMYHCNVRYTDEASFGASLLLGTGKVSREVTVWGINLGNEGASALKVHGKLAWHRGQYVNPYITVNVGYNFPVQVVRRAPYSLNYTASGTPRMIDVLPRSIPFSNVVKMNTKSFSAVPETIARDFGSHAQKVTMYKGFEGGMRIANRCEKCFDQPLFFEVGYELFIGESKDHGHFDDYAIYDVSVLNKNTYRLGNTIDATFGYHFNDTCALSGNFSYNFAGRNMTANYHTALTLNVRF